MSSLGERAVSIVDKRLGKADIIGKPNHGAAVDMAWKVLMSRAGVSGVEQCQAETEDPCITCKIIGSSVCGLVRAEATEMQARADQVTNMTANVDQIRPELFVR